MDAFSGRDVGISSIGLMAVRHAGPLYDKPVYLPRGTVSEVE
jgi:hypothetical protein